MKVEVTEKTGIKHEDQETGVFYSPAFEDVVTVPASVGELWCSLGWAKDVDGVVPTGERSLQPVAINVDGAKHAKKTTTKGDK